VSKEPETLGVVTILREKVFYLTIHLIYGLEDVPITMITSLTTIKELLCEEQPVLYAACFLKGHDRLLPSPVKTTEYMLIAPVRACIQSFKTLCQLHKNV
jgi:hypothetical protein